MGYVNGTTGNTSGTTLTITYSSTVGNLLFLSIAAVDGISGVGAVQDSNGNDWTVFGAAPWYYAYILDSPAITYVKVNSSGLLAAVLGEYSGIGSVVGQTSNSTLSSPWTVTRTLSSAANWLIAGGGASYSGIAPTITSDVGNLRNSTASPIYFSDYYCPILVDNTGSTSETCAADVTGGGGYLGGVTIGLEVTLAPINATVVISSGENATFAQNNPTSVTGTANTNLTGENATFAVNAPAGSGNSSRALSSGENATFAVGTVTASGNTVINYPSTYHFGFGMA